MAKNSSKRDIIPIILGVVAVGGVVYLITRLRTGETGENGNGGLCVNNSTRVVVDDTCADGFRTQRCSGGRWVMEDCVSSEESVAEIGVRVIDAVTGDGINGATVTMTSSIDSASTITTNIVTQGQAVLAIRLPRTGGDVTISATARGYRSNSMIYTAVPFSSQDSGNLELTPL